MYGGTNFTPEQVAKLLGNASATEKLYATPIPFPRYSIHPIDLSAEEVNSPDGSSKPKISAPLLLETVGLLEAKLSDAIKETMEGAPGYVPDREKPLQGQNICGLAAEGLALLLDRYGIESEIVTVELPNISSCSARSHTFLRTLGEEFFIIDPSYMQFLKGFTECKRLDEFPSIAIFNPKNLPEVSESICKIVGGCQEAIYTAVRYEGVWAVKRQSIMSTEQVKTHISGIWNMDESNTTIRGKDYIATLQSAIDTGNLDSLLPLRDKLIRHLSGAS